MMSMWWLRNFADASMQEKPATAPVINAMPVSRCRRSRAAADSVFGSGRSVICQEGRILGCHPGRATGAIRDPWEPRAGDQVAQAGIHGSRRSRFALGRDDTRVLPNTQYVARPPEMSNTAPVVKEQSAEAQK